jgi:hypothetical protein
MGFNEDGTKVIVARYAQEHPFIKLLDNHKKHAIGT